MSRQEQMSRQQQIAQEDRVDYMLRFQHDLDGAADQFDAGSSNDCLQLLLEEEECAGLDLIDSLAFEKEDKQFRQHEQEMERMKVFQRRLKNRRKSEEKEIRNVVLSVSVS